MELRKVADRRSLLSRFLHDEFARLETVLHRPDWQAVASWAAENGLLDADGNPPSAETLRQAWYRERKSRARQKPAPTPRRDAPEERQVPRAKVTLTVTRPEDVQVPGSATPLPGDGNDRLEEEFRKLGGRKIGQLPRPVSTKGT